MLYMPPGIAYCKNSMYTYDLANNMTATYIETPNSDGDIIYTSDSTYTYNAEGQRIKKVEHDVDIKNNNDKGVITSNYYYTGGSVLYTTNSVNWLTTENILDPGGKIVASERFDDDTATSYTYANKFFFYHFDQRGSTTAIVQPNGNMMKGYTYDEFGNLDAPSGDGNFLNEVTYTGSITDTSTGLQYMNARYYNPKIGRFLSQDTYSGNPYDPWTQHLYSYCGNNPTTMVDPTGHNFDSGGGGGKPTTPWTPPVVPSPTEPGSDNGGGSGGGNGGGNGGHNGGNGDHSGGKKDSDDKGTHANDDIIDALFNGEELGPGQMYYVENTSNIGPLVKGQCILFNRDKYCRYTFYGLSVSLSIPVNRYDSNGIVSHVYNVKDYTGGFINGAEGTGLGTGESKSFGKSDNKFDPWVTQESTSVHSIFPTIGWGAQDYITYQKDWIKGSAPITVVEYTGIQSYLGNPTA